jgi:hypothetical protein
VIDEINLMESHLAIWAHHWTNVDHIDFAKGGHMCNEAINSKTNIKMASRSQCMNTLSNKQILAKVMPRSDPRIFVQVIQAGTKLPKWPRAIET